MNPSFYALFRRSHYRHVQQWDDASEKERLEAERFATSAVAFCLKHDQSFRRSFVKVVSGVDLSNNEAKDLSVNIEPFRMADLLLKVGARALAVVEFKIGHGLKPHQDPTMPAFAAETGYGQWLRQHADDNGIESANFTVLDQSESVIQPCPETRRLKLVVRQLHWDALLAIPHDGQSNPLISDLYETLSSLGVRAMQYEQTNNERVTASLELAGKAGNVLRDVKSQLGCADKYSYIEGSAEASGWWFGMYLLRLQGQTKHAKAFQRQLAKVCAQDGYYLVWYGYMSDPLGKGSQCSVWAWIGNEKKRDHLISKWDETIGICRPDKEGDAAVLTAYRKPDDKTADRDWFVRTLRYISSLK